MNSALGRRWPVVSPLLYRGLMATLWLLKWLIVLTLWLFRCLAVGGLLIAGLSAAAVKRLYGLLAAEAPPRAARLWAAAAPLRGRLTALAWAHRLSVLLVALAAGMTLAPAALHLPVSHGAVVVRTPEPAAAVPQAAGWWQRYTVDSSGYSLALPPEWQVVPLDGNTQARGATADPLLGQRLMERAKERLEAGAALWAALGPQPEGGPAVSINIIRQPLESPLSVEAFARPNIASLKKAGGATALRQEWLSTPAGRVLRVQMTYTAPAEQGGNRLRVTQFFLVNGRDGYCITATAGADRAADYDDTFEAMVRSLRWTS